MKKFSFILMIVTLLCPGISFSKEVINIAVGEFPPRFSEKMENKGIISHIIQQAFALEGIDVKYSFYPWARALKTVIDGKIEGSAIWQKTPDREQYLYFSDPVMDANWMLFYHKDHPIEWENFKDLENMTIGTVIGYTYGKEFDSLIESGHIKAEKVPDPATNFKRLLYCRIDAFIHQPDVAYYHLKQIYKPDEFNKIIHHPKPIQTFSLSLVLSKKIKKNKRYLELFNRGLSALKQKRIYHELINTYESIQKTH